MRNLLLLLVLAFSAVAYGQEDLNCYQKYAKKFEERGAFEVEDGWHEKVVITIRKGSNSECFYGKVKVENGVVVSMFMMYGDGTYESKPIQKSYKHDDEKATITNGISKTRITVDDELINVIFPSHIKPPKKKYETAPDPDDL